MSGGLLVAGAGGHGRVVADAAALLGTWGEIALLDDGLPPGARVSDWSVLGPLAYAEKLRARYSSLVVAIGNNSVRLDWTKRYLAQGLDVVSVVHPSANVGRAVELARGTVVLAGAVINTGVATGLGCIINSGAVVEHDCRLGAGVHISPGAVLAGQVVVGDYSWVGAGAVVREKIRIGRDVTVGIGSAVVADVEDGLTLGGVPARRIVADRGPRL